MIATHRSRTNPVGIVSPSMWAVLALGFLAATQAHADSYPASYWTTKSMSVPVPMCVHAAGKAVHQAGLLDITKSDTATGGHTATTRGYVICVRLPKAGACQGDGSTAVVVTAGADAKQLLEAITDQLKAPKMIDCG